MKSRFLPRLALICALILAVCAGYLYRLKTDLVAVKTPHHLPPLPATLPPNKLSAQAALARVEAERDAYFLNARRENYRSVREILAQQDDELDRGLRYAKLIHGSRNHKQIALTFDDGPHPQYTPRLLEILKREHIPATFFLVGMEAEKYPDLVRSEQGAGHEIANHTYHHVSLPKIPQEYVADEIKACGLVLKAITGEAPRYFRPPGGEYDREVAEASRVLGYTMVLWTDDPGDYASPGEEVILQRTLAKATPGGILLLHDGIEQTVMVLPRLIETLKAQGYEFVTLDELTKRGKPAAPAAPKGITTVTVS